VLSGRDSEPTAEHRRAESDIDWQCEVIAAALPSQRTWLHMHLNPVNIKMTGQSA